MSIDVRPPLITGQTLGEQVQQLIAYLTRLARQLRDMPESRVEVEQETEEELPRNSFHKLRVQKELILEGGVNQVYIRRARVWSTNEFVLKTMFSNWNSNGELRQSFLISGCVNSIPLLGVVRLNNNGACQWQGTAGVTLHPEDGGFLRVRLPDVAYDHLIVQSPYEFHVL